MSDNKNLIRVGDATRCPDCGLTYRDPRVLSCGHSFCKECISKFVVVKSVSCPKCQKSSHVPHGNVENLMKNLALVGLVDAYRSPCDATSSMKCNECREYERREAVVHCYSCQRSLCSLCSSSHVNYQHSVVKISQYESESMRIRDMTTQSLLDRTKAKEKVIDQRMNLIQNQIHRVDSASSKVMNEVQKSYNDHMNRLLSIKDQMMEQAEERQDFVLSKLKTVQDFTKTFKESVSTISANLMLNSGQRLRGDTLKNHIKLCHELEMLLEADIDLNMVKETSAFIEGFEFRRGDFTSYNMGSIKKVDVGWSLGFDMAVLPSNANRCMCPTPDGRVAIGFARSGGGLIIIAPDEAQIVPKQLKGIFVNSVAFLPDGRCAILDLDNMLSLYGTTYERLDYHFKTLSSEDAGAGQLCVDEQHFIYVAYKMDRRIHKFSPMGGKPLENFMFYRIDPLDLRVSHEGALILVSWHKILVMGPSGESRSELQHNAQDQFIVADVCSDDTLIVAFISQRTGKGGLDRLTVRRFLLDEKLTMKETLFSDQLIALSPAPFYSIRELVTGEIAFCTKGRLYLFRYHSGKVNDVGFTEFNEEYQTDKSQDF